VTPYLVYYSLDFALSDNSYNFSNGGSLWSHEYFYTSPHFWTAVVVLVLAFFLILQNAYSFRKYVASIHACKQYYIHSDPDPAFYVARTYVDPDLKLEIFI
jgi:hypothetical protein